MLSNYVSELEKESKLKEGMLIKLNFNYRSIKSIDPINQRYQFIKQLYLNHNQIESLKGIEQFANLEELHIKFNYISSLEELERIQNKQYLTILNLKGNPVEKNSKCCFDFLISTFHNLNELNENVRYNNSSASGTGLYLKDHFNSSRGTRSISYTNFNSRNKQKLISNAKELVQVLENTIQRQNSCSGLKSYRTPNKYIQVQNIQTGNNFNLNEINSLCTDREYYNTQAQTTHRQLQNTLTTNHIRNGYESSRDQLNGMLSSRMLKTFYSQQNNSSLINNNQMQTNSINQNSINVNQILNQNKSSQNIGIINQFLNTHSSRVNSIEKQIQQQQDSSKKQSQQAQFNQNFNGSIQTRFNNQVQGFEQSLQALSAVSHRPKSISNYSTNITQELQTNVQSLRNQTSYGQLNTKNFDGNQIHNLKQDAGHIQNSQRSISQYNSSQSSCNQIRSNQGHVQSQQNFKRNSSTQGLTNNIQNYNENINLAQNYNSVSPHQADACQNSSQKKGTVMTEGNSIISFNQSKVHMFQQLSFKKEQVQQNSYQKSRQNSDLSLCNVNSISNNYNQKDYPSQILQPTNRKLFPPENQSEALSQQQNNSKYLSNRQEMLNIVENQKIINATLNQKNVIYDENNNSKSLKQQPISQINKLVDLGKENNNIQNNFNQKSGLQNKQFNNQSYKNQNMKINFVSSQQQDLSKNMQINSNQQKNQQQKNIIDIQEVQTKQIACQSNQEIQDQNFYDNQSYQQYNSIKNNNQRLLLNNTNINYSSQSKKNQQNHSISFLSNENCHTVAANNRYSSNDQQIQTQRSVANQHESNQINPNNSLPISTEIDNGGYSSSQVTNQIDNQTETVQPFCSTTSVDQIPISTSISITPNLQNQQQSQLQIRNSTSNESLFTRGVPVHHVNQATATFAKQSKLQRENTQEGGPFNFKKCQSNLQIIGNQKHLQNEIQQSYNNYPLDTQNNPLDTDLSFDNNLVPFQNQNKQKKRAFSQNQNANFNGIGSTNNLQNQQVTSQNQFTQNSQQLQSNFNEMASLNLSRISHINGKSFMNISIPHMKFDGCVLESQGQFQIEDDNNILVSNNINPNNLSTQFLSVPPQQRRSVIISDIINQGKQQCQNSSQNYQNSVTKQDNQQNILRQSSNLSFLNKSSVFYNDRLNLHIENIDTDIEQLAIFFYQKSLKEKAFKSLFYLKAFNAIEQKIQQPQLQQETQQQSRYNSSLKNSTQFAQGKAASPLSQLQNSNKQENHSQTRSSSSLNNIQISRQSPLHTQISSPNLANNDVNNLQILITQNSIKKQPTAESGQENVANFVQIKDQNQMCNNQSQSINDCSGMVMHQNTLNYSEEDEMLLTQHNLPLQRDYKWTN
ncbi:hypothetical protein TTHERM_00266260 (macronuclear) [Tetrahymena thermophila SB210]|uniref:Uncharacterized protein n=1 Tax=Tetrahymena thermophila (strain SB210) TaxID=312017 RepID=I7LUP0_TETTS|nr:hypothetical protein TTHERM_00266260 [Tetrahymena thermophila SB210]EAR95616.2 hypothetical protein TTHERM_00266260 [Tetrahymena thermophila SB210]|eukprot:XP_001015861.2 hypothetical protein TTHERM_00266260 [Tetrahymena thermophila SB210]